MPNFSSYANWLVWLRALHLSSISKKNILDVVFYVTWWSIWEFRNSRMFGISKPKAARVFDNIVSKSYFWCNTICKKDIN